MGTTTVNMGLSVPTLDGDPGVWDTQLSASLALLDLHDHSAGKGVKVPSAGININADLTFAGYSLTNLRAAVYTAQASFATAKATYVIGDDLYYRDGSSNQIRLTASGGINIATTGGFTGDYIASGAAAYYDDANETYRFLKAAPAPNNWSRVACGSVDLYEYGSGILTRVRLSSPAALAASYEVTFPAALPADTSLFQITSAGVVTFSNTVVKAVTMSELTTFSAGATASANQHFTVSGTGRFKHGTLTRMVHFVDGYPADATAWSYTAGYVACNPASSFYVALAMDVGERLINIDFTYYGNGAANITWEVNKYSASAAATLLDSGTINAPAAAWATLSGNAINDTLAAGSSYVLSVTTAGANFRFGAVTIYYDRP